MGIEGLWYIDHTVHSDARGFYAELARIPELDPHLSSPFIVKQINLSHSEKKVIRGFHAENWRKLLTVISGSCFCAWVDVRPTSNTFGKTVTLEIDAEDKNIFGSVFVDAGIANSFCVTKGPANYVYCVDQLYKERDTSGDVAISLFDPTLGISWPFEQSELIISERDKRAVSLYQRFPEKKNV